MKTKKHQPDFENAYREVAHTYDLVVAEIAPTGDFDTATAEVCEVEQCLARAMELLGEMK